MPFACAGDLNLYYEIHGSGPNLVLIEGLGYDSWMWYRQLPDFSAHFRTLIYDNRGVGRSDMPPGPYTHSQNAHDLVGLLDLLGWERTHVLGVSMGGFIAQEFALAYPERLDKLVLVATAFGGPHMVPVPPEAQKALLPDPDLSLEARIRKVMPLAFGDATWPERHADEFEEIIRWRLTYPQPPGATIAQAMAALSFDTQARLSQIAAPTLIVTGTNDNVVPPENAHLLAAEIPRATLDVIPHAGHLVFIDEAKRFNRDVIEFLEQVPA